MILFKVNNMEIVRSYQQHFCLKQAMRQYSPAPVSWPLTFWPSK